MTRLVEALKEVGQTFELFQKGELGPCDSTASAISVANLMPSTICQVPASPAGKGVKVEPKDIDPSAPDLRIDPTDEKIDVRAKFALKRMLKIPETPTPEDVARFKDAARLIRGINGGTLDGIFGDDLGKAVEVAQAHGTERWLLVPKGEDAALVLVNEGDPLNDPPTVIFRGDTPDINKEPGRLEEALSEASTTFALFQDKLVLCASSPSAKSVSNIVPPSFCRLQGQDLVVEVTEKSTQPPLPVPGAGVVATGPHPSAATTPPELTDKLGHALFEDLAPGTYHVTASKEGFEDASTEVLHPVDILPPGNQVQTVSFVEGSTQGAPGRVPLLLTKKKSWFLPATVRPITHNNEVTAYVKKVEDVLADMRQAIKRTDNRTNFSHFIYLAGWLLDIDSEMGPLGSPTFRKLLEEAADVRNVPVRALLYDRQFDISWNTNAETFINGLKNSQAIQDERFLVAGSHHQKLLIVSNSDGLVAFCGSMDIAANPASPHVDRRRWHEVHCRVTGPGARDLHNTFAERWNDYRPESLNPFFKKKSLMVLKTSLAPVSGTADVQVVRTYGNGSAHRGIGANPIGLSPEGYTFAPKGEQTIYDLIKNGIEQAEVYIYIEDQYLTCSEDMNHGVAVSKLLAEKLKAAKEDRSSLQKLIILIARTCQVNWEIRQGWQRRKKFLKALLAEDDPANPHIVVVQYKANHNIFFHSKTWIFDDELAIISSANCNRRGYSHDSELGVGIVDTIPPDPTGEQESLPQTIRMDLWQKHLSPSGGKLDRRTLFDPALTFQLWDNLDPAGKLEHYNDNLSEVNKCPDGDLKQGEWFWEFSKLVPGTGSLPTSVQWDQFIDPDGS